MNVNKLDGYSTNLIKKQTNNLLINKLKVVKEIRVTGKYCFRVSHSLDLQLSIDTCLVKSYPLPAIIKLAASNLKASCDSARKFDNTST